MCLCHWRWSLSKPSGTMLRSRIFPTVTEKMLRRFDFTDPRQNGKRNFRVILTGVALGAMFTATLFSSKYQKTALHSPTHG